jgi:hypothetical protein
MLVGDDGYIGRGKTKKICRSHIIWLEQLLHTNGNADIYMII